MLREPLCELERARGLAADAQLERLQAAEQKPRCVGCGDRAAQAAQLLDPRAVLVRGADNGAEEDVVVPAEVLRRAVHDDVRAVLERPEQDRCRRGRIDHDACGVGCRGLHVREGQERVRRRFEPDEIGLFSHL